MASTVDEQVLRAAKEIVVKFIETGRVSPTSFPDVFNSIYDTVFDAVNAPREIPGDAPETAE
jgi:hypothetical protein